MTVPPDPIVVQELDIHVVTGETPYPYEDGFAGIWAEVKTSDKVLADRLMRAHRDEVPVTLRCAMLDATGLVTRADAKRRTSTFALSIEELTFRKP